MKWIRWNAALHLISFFTRVLRKTTTTNIKIIHRVSLFVELSFLLCGTLQFCPRNSDAVNFSTVSARWFNTIDGNSFFFLAISFHCMGVRANSSIFICWRVDLTSIIHQMRTRQIEIVNRVTMHANKITRRFFLWSHFHTMSLKFIHFGLPMQNASKTRQISVDFLCFGVWWV